MPAPRNQQLEELLERCILAHEQNDLAAVDEILAAHPGEADELRKRLDRLDQLGVLSVPTGSTGIPERLGEFRLLHEIGHGGMGVVYLAEQEPLERKVALKLVHPDMLHFGNARARFRREVLVIARLQHRGIVPILTCGEAEGVPYYAMEFVAGASLAELLRELAGTSPTFLDGSALERALVRCMAHKDDASEVEDSETFRGSWARSCSQLVLEAATALQYAHDQGVLHRDLKPSNLLLGTDGRISVIDFGLASAGAGDARLTRSGATLGSLPYMAPEQLRSQEARIDARTDVYQLGVTLYELLTLQPPFGDGTGQTRERILTGLPLPPSRCNPSVPADVDAICLKALDVDPERRYATMQDFADDVLAFLERRNVAARRAPWSVRSRRWIRAHPLASTIGLAAFLLLAVVPTGYAIQQSLANQRIRSAYDVAEDRRQLAERNFDEALRAVDLMLTRTATARLADMPRTAGLRRQLVQDAIAVHRRLLSTTEAGGMALAAARARSEMQLGMLHFELGEHDTAERSLRAAGKTLTDLLARADGDEQRLHLDLARCELELGRVVGRLGRRDEMVAAYERMARHYHDATPDPELGEHRLRFLEGKLTLARGLAQVGRTDEAQRAWDELDATLAAETRTGATPAHPLPEHARRLLWSRVASSRGTLAALSGDPAAAAAHFEAAMRRALEGGPLQDTGDGRRRLRHHTAVVAERLGTIQMQRRNWDTAAEWLERSCTEYEALVAADPEIPDWKMNLAGALSARAWNDTQRNDHQAALARHDRAIDLLGDVLEVLPDDPATRRVLAQAHADRALTCQVTGAIAEAHASMAAAAEQFELFLERNPGDAFVRGNYAALLANRALATAADGRHADALELLVRALELQRGLSGFERQRQVIEMELRASEFAAAVDDTQRAARHMQRARDDAAAMLAARPDDSLALDACSQVALEHGVMLQATGQDEDAVDAWSNALPTARRAAQTSPFGRQLLGKLQLRLADAGLRRKDTDVAREWFRAALADGATSEMVEDDTRLRALFDRSDLR